MSRSPDRGTSYPFPYLIDTAEDGYIEEFAWVARDLAKTPEEAIEVLLREWPDGHPLEFDDAYPACALRPAGKEWLVAVWTQYDDETMEPRELRGLEAERESEGDEYLRFVSCDSDTPDAREWWKLERVELCGKWIKPDEMERCLLDPGHEGVCALTVPSA